MSSSCSSSLASTNVATVGFKWMDILEKEFDKSFVALDEVLRTIADDYEMSEMYDVNRKLLSNLGSCFAQAVHKAQTIFQNNAKQEAELIHLREELAGCRATADKLESEKQYLVCRLQSSLLENHKLRLTSASSSSSSSNGSSHDSDAVCREIQAKLAKEMAVIQRVDLEARKVEERCQQLERENGGLRRLQVELESELVGARLDSKYLDKELAGRIQQIQILLAGGTSQEHKQKVWSQIEAEMHLQRSKTISNMCYSKQRVKDQANNSGNSCEKPKLLLSSSAAAVAATLTEDDDSIGSRKSSFNASTRGRVKQVHIHKNDAEELGMAILGGREHGLPIMISEVFPGTAVGRCKKICAGDVILAVNGDNFEDLGHHEAVKYLSALRGTIKFDLENRIDEEIDDVCDMDSRYYELFDEEDDAEHQEARRRCNQLQRILLNHPGRAKEVRKKQEELEKKKDLLPEVHSSPKRKDGVRNGVNV